MRRLSPRCAGWGPPGRECRTPVVRSADEDADGPPVLGVRRRVAALAGAVPGVRRVGHVGRGGRRGARAGRRRRRRARRGRWSGADRRRRRSAVAVPVPTGVAELDRVLEGGLVPGSVSLLAGEPGMGKSTLLLQALGRMAARGTRCLLVTAEESCAQVRLRAERVGALARRPARRGRDLAAARARPRRRGRSRGARARLDPDRRRSRPPRRAGLGHAGARLRLPARAAGEGARRSSRSRRSRHQGGHASPGRACSSTWSTPCSRSTATAATRSGRSTRSKHRFGGTDELGLFEMTERGLRRRPRRVGALPRRPPAGRARLGGRGGARRRAAAARRGAGAGDATPAAPMPRRSASGMESGRLAMLLAVLEQHAAVRSTSADVYASVAGGLRVTERGLDLALVLAVAGAQPRRRGHRRGTVAIGELGLGGEVRSVPQLERRLAEAARLGFTRALVPPEPADRRSATRRRARRERGGPARVVGRTDGRESTDAIDPRSRAHHPDRFVAMATTATRPPPLHAHPSRSKVCSRRRARMAVAYENGPYATC